MSWLPNENSKNEVLPQALKGLAAALGAGSGITRYAEPVVTPEIAGWDDIWTSGLVDVVADAPAGATITVASKLAAIVQGRRVVDPGVGEALQSGVNDDALLAVLRRHVPGANWQDLATLDHDEDAQDGWVLGPSDPNGFVAEVARRLHARVGNWCDVVVIDSGAGVRKGSALVGTPTYFSTPLGATAGLSFVHAQRCAVVGEFYGNMRTHTPFVVIHPEGPRSANRQNVGQPRYSGYLDAHRETLDLPDWAKRGL